MNGNAMTKSRQRTYNTAVKVVRMAIYIAREVDRNIFNLDDWDHIPSIEDTKLTRVEDLMWLRWHLFGDVPDDPMLESILELAEQEEILI